MRQLVIAVIICLAAVIFALQNATPISVNFFLWELPETSMALVLVVTLIIGLIVGLLFLAPGMYRRNRKIADLRRQISELENKNRSEKDNLPPA